MVADDPDEKEGDENQDPLGHLQVLLACFFLLT